MASCGRAGRARCRRRFLLTYTNGICYREEAMDGLADYLAECGVVMSELKFLALVRETFEGIAGKDLWAEPERELPAEELEVLRSGGFSTKREALGADDPVFRGALDFSALIASALSTG